MRNELMGCLILAAAGCATDTKTSSQDAATQQATNQSADFAEQALGASTLAAGMAGQFGAPRGRRRRSRCCRAAPSCR